MLSLGRQEHVKDFLRKKFLRQTRNFQRLRHKDQSTCHHELKFQKRRSLFSALLPMPQPKFTRGYEKEVKFSEDIVFV